MAKAGKIFFGVLVMVIGMSLGAAGYATVASDSSIEYGVSGWSPDETRVLAVQYVHSGEVSRSKVNLVLYDITSGTYELLAEYQGGNEAAVAFEDVVSRRVDAMAIPVFADKAKQVGGDYRPAYWYGAPPFGTSDISFELQKNRTGYTINLVRQTNDGKMLVVAVADMTDWLKQSYKEIGTDGKIYAFNIQDVYVSPSGEKAIIQMVLTYGQAGGVDVIARNLVVINVRQALTAALDGSAP